MQNNKEILYKKIIHVNLKNVHVQLSYAHKKLIFLN